MKIGFNGLLQILFITLKLLNKIDWSWFWVFSPTWIIVVLWFSVVLFTIFAATMGWLRLR